MPWTIFLRDILPFICEQVPGVRVLITGKTEGVPMDKLHLDGHVKFTGFLETSARLCRVARFAWCLYVSAVGPG